MDALLTAAANIGVSWQPCIRDIWHDHVLFEGDRVSGLIDFGALRCDTVAGDVARLAESMAGDDFDQWQCAVDAYRAIRPLSDDELTLVQAFDRTAPLLAAINWIDWIFRSGRTFDDPAEVTCRVKKILSRFESFSGSFPLAAPIRLAT